MKIGRTIACVLIFTGLLAAIAFAQRGRSFSRSNSRTANSEGRPERNGTLDWELDKDMPKDVFTFVRVKYSTGGRSRYGYGFDYGYGRGGRFLTDYPDADVNLAFRLQQMTSLKVHPDGVILAPTEKELFDYPFIYIVEPGDLLFSEEEVKTLRKYLLNGGFLMVDDFWGEAEWENFYREIKRVFPEREPAELPMEHPIFNCVFPMDKFARNKLQVPNINVGAQSRYTGITWERYDARDVHLKGLFDDKGRLMVMICHNTDNGDGWEREGEDEYYFHEFSEKIAYPLMINILFYAMTH